MVAAVCSLVTNVFSQVGPVYAFQKAVLCFPGSWTCLQPRGGWVDSRLRGHEGSHVASPGASRAKPSWLGWVCASLGRPRWRGGQAPQAEEAGAVRKVARRSSRWPWAEEAAPPFPEAAPSTPLGSAPGSVWLWRRAGPESPAKQGHLLFPFPYYLAGTPSADLHRGKGEAEGDDGERQPAPQAFGPAGCLWRRRGPSRLAGLRGGERAEPGAAGLCGAPWSLPRISLCGSPSLSLISADLPPSRGLWPGPGCRGPSHPRCRVVGAPPPVPTCATQIRSLNPSAGENQML